MNTQALVLALLAAASATLLAQDEVTTKPAATAPTPHHDAHAALRALTGDWRCTTRTEPMPGVPGMEEATESEGTEHAELICDGLWLKSDYRGNFAGEPFAGVWLVGYDPFAESYVGLWVGSAEEDCGPTVFTGEFDAGADTWTWTGDTPDGRMRSTVVFETPNRSIETCYLQTPEGEEVKCMEMVRERTDDAAPTEASASVADDLPEQQRRLLKDIGRWTAVVETTPPGAETSRDRAVEDVIPILDGRWLWSHFKGRIHGNPYEGHALYGWSPDESRYVSYWIDSMSPTLTKTTGSFDSSSEAMRLSGTSRDATGKRMQIRETQSYDGDDTRILRMQFGSGNEASTMEITYRRSSRK